MTTLNLQKCNRATVPVGKPTEIAIEVLAESAGSPAFLQELLGKPAGIVFALNTDGLDGVARVSQLTHLGLSGSVNRCPLSSFQRFTE
jgi:hypothetical protein